MATMTKPRVRPASQVNATGGEPDSSDWDASRATGAFPLYAEGSWRIGLGLGGPHMSTNRGKPHERLESDMPMCSLYTQDGAET